MIIKVPRNLNIWWINYLFSFLSNDELGSNYVMRFLALLLRKLQFHFTLSDFKLVNDSNSVTQSRCFTGLGLNLHLTSLIKCKTLLNELI